MTTTNRDKTMPTTNRDKTMPTTNKVATIEEQILDAMVDAEGDTPAQDVNSLYVHNCNVMYAVNNILNRQADEVIQYAVYWGDVSFDVVGGELFIYSPEHLSYNQILELEALVDAYGLDYSRSYETETYIGEVRELAEHMEDDADIQEHYGEVETSKVEDILRNYHHAHRAILDMEYIKEYILDIEPIVEDEELAA